MPHTHSDSHVVSHADSSLLLTDLYQLTMLDAYHQQGMSELATFDLFLRRLPPERNFLLLCGIEPLVHWLQQARFTEQEIEQLAQTGLFSDSFLSTLAQWRFTGELWAMPEGSVCFASEPLVRVTAPIYQAQLIESRLMNLIHYATLVASKAARCMLAAPQGKAVVDFGLRRAHGAEAAMLAARGMHLAGFSGTATVLAGLSQRQKLVGTMAHSFVQAHESEVQAFADFVDSQQQPTTLLIDTYDTERGARRVVELADKLAAHGKQIAAVRIDSGDLAEHARNVRQILDSGGYPEVKITASGNLDEYALAKLREQQAPIDGFGVGTHVVVSKDCPTLDTVYKLAEYAGSGRRKQSEHKATWPGKKQVWRHNQQDTIGLASENLPGEPLLKLMLQNGQITPALGSLQQARKHAALQLSALPAELRALTPASKPYPVKISDGLQQAAKEVDKRLAIQTS